MIEAKTMKGVVLLGDRQVEVREFPVPHAGPGEVVVKITAAAICGSDYLFYITPQEIFANLGGISGHEPAGVVAETGEGVSNVKVGDRVALYHYTGCGTCEHCLSGNIQQCSNRLGLGWKLDGSNAEYIRMPAANCLLLPEELSDEDGTFIACIAGTTYSALKKLQVSGRDILAVYGLGPVGLTAVMLAKAMGAVVIGIEQNDYRLEFAKKLGADYLIDSKKEDMYERIMEITGGVGAEKSIECSGSNVLRKMTAKAASIEGKICLVGNSEGIMNDKEELLAHFDQRFIIRKELTICGSYVMPRGMYPELARFLVRKGIHLDDMVTHRFKLDDAAEAFRLFGTGNTGKVMFRFDE